MIAKHFRIDPNQIYDWPYWLFLDALEHLHVTAEIERVQQRLLDKS